MRIIRGVHNIREDERGPVCSIGTFDGVHIGHQAILGEANRLADKYRTSQLLVTFEPHPSEFFAKGSTPARLTRFREKVTVLKSLGIQRILCLPFNAQTSSLTHNSFVDNILVDGLSIRHIVLGDDFRFGKGALGDSHSLREAGKNHGFGVSQIPTFSLEGERVSSTRIRKALGDGDFDLAAKMLGRPYSMSGKVVSGSRLGHQLGKPTANIELQRTKCAMEGIFAVTVQVEHTERNYSGAAYIGTRPTLDGTETLLEVHLFDFDQYIYGKRVRVTFWNKIRDDHKFQNLDALQAQMTEDVMQVKTWFEEKKEPSTA